MIEKAFVQGKDLRSGDFFIIGEGDDVFHPGTYFVLSNHSTSEYKQFSIPAYVVNMMWVYHGGRRVRFDRLHVPANKILTQCVRYFEVVHTHDT
jgi:hypothetical protein